MLPVPLADVLVCSPRPVPPGAITEPNEVVPPELDDEPPAPTE